MLCTSVCTYLSPPIPKKKQKKKQRGSRTTEEKKKKKRKKGTLPSPLPVPGGKDVMGCKKAIGCVFFGGGGWGVVDRWGLSG